jgi:hypothetical protein
MKVRGENFNRRVGIFTSNSLYNSAEVGSAPIFEIVAGHHRDDDVGEFKLFYRGGHPFRFIVFEGLWGL